MTAEQFNTLAGEPPKKKSDDGLEIPEFLQGGYKPASKPRKKRNRVRADWRTTVKPYFELMLSGFALGTGLALAYWLICLLMG